MPVSPAAGAGHALVLSDLIRAALPDDPEQITAIAVSGGGDSLALLHLAVGVVQGQGHRLRAVTVDHRLRPAAAQEAAMVARLSAQWGIRHDVLVWDHSGRVDGNLMQAARQARYVLLADWAQAQGVAQILLGHTADDQAEGFLMALSRRSGLDGLSGMAAQFDHGGMRFLRPLLSARRQDLRDYLIAQGVGWVDDPTNEDDSYLRARIRKAMAILAPLGVDTDSILTSLGHLSRTRAALGHVLADWAADHVETPHGLVEIGRAAFGALHPELRRRLVLAALTWLTRADHPPRGADQARFVAAIAQGQAATLAGCRARIGKDVIRLSREPRALGAVTAKTGAGGLWDGRWRITGPQGTGADIRALGSAGLTQFPDWRASAIPREALIVSPALWCGDRLIAAPLLQPDGPWRAECVTDFRFFILSH